MTVCNRRFFATLVLAAPLSLPAATPARELRLAMRHDPKTFDPFMVEEDASETIRYLTGGVLLRVNRRTQKAEPELAESWKVTGGGRVLHLKLRPSARFSDGTPVTADDVAYTFARLADPSMKAAVADTFRAGAGPAKVAVSGRNEASITFSNPVVALENLLDEIPIQPARQPAGGRTAAGPFAVAEYQPGIFLVLKRNPHYWRKDA